MLSGYLFSTTKYFGNFKDFIKNRSRSLLLPYLSAGLLFYLYFIARNILTNDWETEWLKPLFGMFYGTGESLGAINTPLWFLLCLFMTQLIFVLIMSYLNKSDLIMQIISMFIVGFIGYYISFFAHLPWSIDIALVAQPFFFLGFKIKEYNFLPKIKMMSFYALLLAAIFTATTYYNVVVDMNYRIYGNILFFYLCGISGSLLAIMIVKIFEKMDLVKKALSYIGSKSLAILIYHVGFFILTIHIIEKRLLDGTEIHWLIVVIISVIGSLLVNNVVVNIPILNFLLNGVESKDKVKHNSGQSSVLYEN